MEHLQAIEHTRVHPATPVTELDGSLGLDGGNSGVYILGDDITTVHYAARHVLSVTGVALDHHGGRLEHSVSNLRNGELLVVGLLTLQLHALHTAQQDRSNTGHDTTRVAKSVYGSQKLHTYIHLIYAYMDHINRIHHIFICIHGLCNPRHDSCTTPHHTTPHDTTAIQF
jgi:hypothetical protein